MTRFGVILLSADSAAAAFVDGLLDEIGQRGTPVVVVDCARSCAAAASGSRRRRLLVLDGIPKDLGAGAVIEAVRLVDPALPIVLVREGWQGPPIVRAGTVVLPGPLVSQTAALVLRDLLREEAA